MMPSPASVAIMATSQADTTKSASTSVTINISLALNLNSASVEATGTQQFTATIQGSTNTDVTWTVNGVAGGNSTLGTISNTGLYTAPAYPPSPNTVTVTATSVAEGSIAASSTVTVAAPPISVSVPGPHRPGPPGGSYRAIQRRGYDLVHDTDLDDGHVGRERAGRCG